MDKLQSIDKLHLLILNVGLAIQMRIGIGRISTVPLQDLLCN